MAVPSPREPVGYEPDGPYAKFLSWTDEKTRLTEALSLELGPQHRTMLDVGAGDGSITKPLSSHMTRVVALEPSINFSDAPSNTLVVNEKVETFLAHDQALFDFVLVSHVLNHIENVRGILDALWQRVFSGGCMAIVMLTGHSAYRDFVWAFAPEVNPQLSKSGYKSEHLEQDLAEMGLHWRRNVITTSLTTPNIEDFLSINSMHFNSQAVIPPEMLERMRTHLEEHLTEDGALSLDVQHAIYIIER